MAFSVFTASAGNATAQFLQQRLLPAKGERGVLGEPQRFPLVKIGNRTLRLTPGARIFDRDNRTIVHAHLPAGAEILFLRDATGDVHRIFVLTAQEILHLRQAGVR